MNDALIALEGIARDRAADLLADIVQMDGRLRLVFHDTSFCDVHVAETMANRFSFHWERRHLDGTIYRYDTFPDRAARRFRSYPRHFHDGTQERIVAPPFRAGTLRGFTDFLDFIRERFADERAAPSGRRRAA